jgi:hypothetical protein
VLQVSKNFVVICNDLTGDALTTFITNKMRGNMNPLVIKAPSFGDRRKAMLEDIAILTGGTFITKDMGRKLAEAQLADLGHAHRIVSDRSRTTIIEGAGSDEAIQARIRQIRAQIQDTVSDFDREKLQERLAKLAGGVAVIKAGGATEVEVARRSSAWRTPSPPPARRWRRAWCRAAASPTSASVTRWTRCSRSSRATSAPAWRSSSTRCSSRSARSSTTPAGARP